MCGGDEDRCGARPGIVTRSVLVIGLVLCGVTLGVTSVAVAVEGDGLPVWFVVLFNVGSFGLIVTLAAYVRAICKGRLLEPRSIDRVSAVTLGLVVAAMLFTSAGHQFYPFRLSLFDRLEGTPLGYVPPSAVLKFNYAFTGFALIAAVTCVVGYVAGLRRLATTGMAVLAVVLLIPNDDCGNAFNRLWIESIGASPMMFSPAAAGVLIGVCGLCQLWRRISLAILATICVTVLLTGIGHMTSFLW